MPVLKVKNNNGEWQDIATAYSHGHTVSDITDLPASLVDDVESLKDKVGVHSVAYQVSTAVEANNYTHPETHPANMITGLSDVAISGSYNDLKDLPTVTNQTQVDWNQNDDTQIDYIKNKPEIPSIDGLATEKYVQEQIASIGSVSEQVQADWDETDTTSPAYIKNKPTISGDGGASVQANWNQMDSAQADFIKNKPFYEYNGLIDVFPRTKYDNFTPNSYYYNLCCVQTTSDYTLTLGETYKVFWDGIAYDCIAQDGNILMTGCIVLGNAANFGLIGNNEPFIIGWMNGAVMYFSLTDQVGGNSHLIRIAKEGIIAKHLDNKYLSILDYIPESNIINNLLPITQYDNFTLDEEYGVRGVSAQVGYALTIGETYTVSWDGNEYECIGQDGNTLMDGCIILGNAAPFGLAGNNEPFIIGWIDGYAMYFSLIDQEDGGSHEIRIYQNKIIDAYYKLKDEYAPNVSWDNISDKPFGEIPAGTVVLDENITVGAVDGQFSILSDLKTQYIILDASYTVTIGDIDYIGTCLEEYGLFGIMAFDSNGNQVCVIAINYQELGIDIIAINTSLFGTGESCDVKITFAEPYFNTIPEEYLPDGAGLPEVTTSDNNKVMTVVDGVWVAQTPASGLPDVTTSDAGKFLRVSSDGVWAVEAVLNFEEVSF